MRKILVIAAVSAAMALLTACAQAPNVTAKGILNVGLTDSDVSGIDGFSADVEEVGEATDPVPMDYETYPGVPEECLGVYTPGAALSDYDQEVQLNRFITQGDDVDSTSTLGTTFALLYDTEEAAQEDYRALTDGFENSECMDDDVVATILEIEEDSSADAEEIDPRCATDCRMLQLHYVSEPTDDYEGSDGTGWSAFMQRGNAIIGMSLTSFGSYGGEDTAGLTLGEAVALVNLQAAKFNSYAG